MTEEELATLADLCEKATPGPWVTHWGGFHVGPEANVGKDVCSCEQQKDGHFIAAAREALPALIAEVRRLRAAAAAQEVFARLEAWASVGNRDVEIHYLEVGWSVFLLLPPYPHGQGEFWSIEVDAATVGSADKPATLPEVINAALDEWERRYG